MDDITIGGPVASVMSNIKGVVDDGSAKGVHLNVTGQCEIISDHVSPSIVP